MTWDGWYAMDGMREVSACDGVTLMKGDSKCPLEIELAMGSAEYA